MREGGLDVQFWSIYVGETSRATARAIREALERIDAVWELARRHPASSRSRPTAPTIRRAVAQGKLASLMGVEGGHMIEEELAALRNFHRLGVRYMTLTHSVPHELGGFLGHERAAAAAARRTHAPSARRSCAR